MARCYMEESDLESTLTCDLLYKEGLASGALLHTNRKNQRHRLQILFTFFHIMNLSIFEVSSPISDTGFIVELITGAEFDSDRQKTEPYPWMM